MSLALSSGKLILTVTATALVKANNATALDQGGSWVSGTAPGGSQWALWSGSYAAANLTNALQNSVTWGGIMISNVSPAGVAIAITNYSNTINLNLNGMPNGGGGVAIDMSSATDDLVLGSFRTYIQASTAFTVASGRTLTFPNNLQLQAYTLTLNGAGNYAVPGQVYGSGASGVLVMSGSGSLSLNNANYCPLTTLNSGTLKLNHSFAVSGSANYTLAINGGALDSSTSTSILNSPNNLWNGDFTFIGTSALNLGAGPVTLGGNRIVICNASTLTVGGAIGDGGAGYSLTKSGAGTLTLAAANTYSGLTAVNNGTLALDINGTIAGSPGLSIGAGATFDVSAKTTFTLGVPLTATTNATIRGGTSVNLGSQPITLNYDGSNPSLVVSLGTLSLNGNAFVVNGHLLAPGTYVLARQTSGNISSGSSTYPASGTAIPGGVGSTIRVVGNEVILSIPPSGSVFKIR